MAGLSQEDIGMVNRQRILREILGEGATSRLHLADRLGLNSASVSRITRDLIDAQLVCEVSVDQPTGRRGPRSKKLVMNSEGGYIIGIGINAFQQVVTLADLSNKTIASWSAEGAELTDASNFLRMCCSKANELVDQHVPDRSRLFGVGLTVAGELDKSRGVVISAPTLGWTTEVEACRILRDNMDVPVVLETPSHAICQSEAAFGLAREARTVMTIYCSLGFGVGVRINQQPFGGFDPLGSVLTETKIARDITSGAFGYLSDLCGGRALLREMFGDAALAGLTDQEKALKVYEILSATHTVPPAHQAMLGDIGLRSANAFALCLSVVQPDLLLLAGPLAQSPHYFEAFQRQIGALGAVPRERFEIKRSELTQMGAARLLSLSENIANAKLDLVALRDAA